MPLRVGATLLLDRGPWDLALDGAGNIALASEPYAIVQDVASACRLFAGELYYDTARGVPFFTEVLGRFQPTSILKARLIEAALSVPGVLSAKVYLATVSERGLRGFVLVTTAQGSFAVAL